MNHFFHVQSTNNDLDWKNEDMFNIRPLNTSVCTDPFISIYEDVVMIHEVCKVWNSKNLTPSRISLNDAKNTITAITKRNITNSEGMRELQFQTAPHQHLFKYLWNGQSSKFCSDTYVSKFPFLRGNQYMINCLWTGLILIVAI